jgi:hypothetical protein
MDAREIIQKAIAGLDEADRELLQEAQKSALQVQESGIEQCFTIPYEGVKRFTRPVQHDRIRHDYRLVQPQSTASRD